MKVILGGAVRSKDFCKCVSASVKLVKLAYQFDGRFLYIIVLKVIQGGALRSKDFRDCVSASIKAVKLVYWFDRNFFPH